MQQLEIKFFWPLTEQIPLDLDYSVCVKPSLAIDAIPSECIAFNSNIPKWDTKIVFDTENIAFKVTKKPSAIRRLLYKIMGFDWELK